MFKTIFPTRRQQTPRTRLPEPLPRMRWYR
jgi:hypothetical protein